LRYHTMPLTDMPPVFIEFLPGDKRKLIKGIGELPFSCVPSAFAQATAQAIGGLVDTIPVDSSACFAKAARS
jgi:CO/xanthine dehydrogenase Mo-binding subunit